MSKIVHYRNKCIGCGICYEMQPELWRMSKKDGKAVLLNAEMKKDIFIFSLPPSIEQQARKVAGVCPARVIKIV